jgi:predicted ATPase
VGQAGLRSLEHSALVEAVAQLTRALAQIAALPATSALRREQIKLQVALITPLVHVKGYAAPETRAAEERARLLIEQAEALGEPPEDPLLLFSVLYGFWVANLVAFDGNAVSELATQFLTVAKKQEATGLRMVGHRLRGMSLLCTGSIVESRVEFDQAISLYDPAKHLPVAMRFGQDVRVAALTFRSWALWLLGYCEAVLADTEHALKDAREIGQAATLMYRLVHAPFTYLQCGSYATAKSDIDELVALADEKGTWRSTGSTVWAPLCLANLATAYSQLGQFDDAWRCIGEATTAVETTKEGWFEAEVHRVAGEIALKSPEPDAAKAEAYFERALTVARAQQAKSWELRTAMSLARLLRDQGKVRQARKLLAPVYGWFTEGFDTRDLKEAKVLLEELAA